MAGLERPDPAILQARRRARARGWHLRAGLSGDLPVPRSPTIAAGHGGENRRWRQIRPQAQVSGRPSLGDGSRENVWPEAQAMSLRGRPVGSKPALSGAAFHLRAARRIGDAQPRLPYLGRCRAGRRWTGLLREPDRAGWSPGPFCPRGDGKHADGAVGRGRTSATVLRAALRGADRGIVERLCSPRVPAERPSAAAGSEGQRAASSGCRRVWVALRQEWPLAVRRGCFPRVTLWPRRQTASTATRSSESSRPRGRGERGRKCAGPRMRAGSAGCGRALV